MIEFRSKLDGGKMQALDKSLFKRLWWLFALISVLITALGVLIIVFKEGYGDISGGIIYIGWGVLFMPLTYLATKLGNRFDQSIVLISRDIEEVYTFDEQYITITQTKGTEYAATTKAEYSYLYKAYEDKNYYYLYLSKTQPHAIAKASITQGTLDEMQTLLKTNLGKKFKSK